MAISDLCGHHPHQSHQSWLSPSGILILLILSPVSLSSPLAQKLLGKLCEQNKVLREQERLVQQLRAEKVRDGTSGGHTGTWGWHLRGEEVMSPREGLG